MRASLPYSVASGGACLDIAGFAHSGAYALRIQHLNLQLMS